MVKVVVGLGNIGEKYRLTRHNVGFLYVDYLAKSFGVAGEVWRSQDKFKAEILELERDGEKWLLVKPKTFMNLSGETVLAIKQFYKLENADFLIVYDDIDLPFGTTRRRENGSAGTHNGMRSVIGVLASEAIPRLRIGVESRSEELKAKFALRDFVLANFSAEELEQLPQIFAEA